MWACITEQREAKWLQGEVQTLGMNNTAIEQGWLIPYIHMYMYVCMGWLVERESERERERERESHQRMMTLFPFTRIPGARLSVAMTCPFF